MRILLTVTIVTIWKYKLQSRKGKMCSALSSRVEWTSASDSGGKLDFSRSNESFLQEVIKYIEDVVREHHHESEVTFKSPFVWKSSLGISSFDSLKSPEYIIRYLIYNI